MELTKGQKGVAVLFIFAIATGITILTIVLTGGDDKKKKPKKKKSTYTNEESTRVSSADEPQQTFSFS